MNYRKIVLSLVVFLMAGNAFAFVVIYGNNLFITQPIYGDLYIAGGTVTINAPIHGDLICAAGTVTINDSVLNDILVAGGTVIFNGYAGDDIRCAGGKLQVQKNVTGDLVIAGGQIMVNKDVVIGNGLLMSGGDMVFEGTVKDNVKAAVGNLVFNGTVEKDIDIRGGKLEMNGVVNGASVLAAPEIVIGNNASFRNDVRYWNRTGSLDFKSAVTNAKTSYDPSLKIDTGRWYYLGGISLLGLLWYMGMALLTIAIIQYLFSTTMRQAGDTAFNATLKSLGWGALFFILVPVAAVVAFITVIGVPIGLLLLLNYVMVVILATVISSVVAANWLNNRFTYKWNYWKLVLAALGIFVVFKLISSTPFLGGLLMLVIACLSFGSILQNINWKRRDYATAVN
jgi:hypothetical protein